MGYIMQNSMILFSGGKDSMYALEKVMESGGVDLVVSITSKEGDTQLHAGPETNKDFREAQLALLGFPIARIKIGDSRNYLNELYLELKHLVEARKIRFLVTGDLWHPYTGGVGDMLAGALNVTIVRPARDACPSYEYGRSYCLKKSQRLSQQ